MVPGGTSVIELWNVGGGGASVPGGTSVTEDCRVGGGGDPPFLGAPAAVGV